ncbi:putative protein kinase RLK-Pelle-LRR-IX family [Helianthus debilis subsp. tardiflorus]
MESGAICNKALDEFESEILVLTKVRQRHLVLLLGYSTQGLKRILVYENKPQGELSRLLFHWKNFKLEPLYWKRRLSIALDVARVKLIPDGGKSIMTQVAGTFGYVAPKYASNYLFSFYIYIYVSIYIYIYMYIYFGCDKRAGWKPLTFGMGQG